MEVVEWRGRARNDTELWALCKEGYLLASGVWGDRDRHVTGMWYWLSIKVVAWISYTSWRWATWIQLYFKLIKRSCYWRGIIIHTPLHLDFVMNFKDMAFTIFLVDEESISGEVAVIWWVRIWTADSILDPATDCFVPVSICSFVHLSTHSCLSCRKRFYYSSAVW